ncbi:hypothetical protein [Roseiflexus sp.]|uniref:hypothetical protein n=1 Tax=Roseiflexus sp. TaxID=2562120 RepID=UPI0021DE3BCF|nr:hypothetical protein [Roseiflexus sp.]GIW01952.1 MAG: hypothetical protein KatS3mg058_3355 [Roseiflexus sp.]
MTTPEVFRYAGWSAYLSAAATIVGFVTLIVFFSVGGPFGTINDISSSILALSLLPLALALYLLLRPCAALLSLIALIIGICAMLAASILQILLVLRVVKSELTLVAVPATFGVVGVWLLLNSYLALASRTLPSGLAWVGMVAGVGYILVILGFLLGGQQHPLTAVGGLTAVIGYPIWAIWIGGLLLSGILIT